MATDIATREAVVARSKRAAGLRKKLWTAFMYAFLVFGALAILVPYIWMVIGSLKPEEDMFRIGILESLIPSRLYLGNYEAALSQYPVILWLFNTLLVATVDTLSTLATSILAGYAFARLRFWGRDKLFYLYLGAMMVPIQVTLIPSFIIVKNLGMLNTYQGIAVLQLVQFMGVFLMRQFFLNIPSDLEDAARIDGCSWFRVLWQIVLPVSWPAVTALAVLAFTAAWNNFLWPLVVINKPEIMTIVVGLASLKSDVTPWGIVMAATTISALPLTVIYVIGQRMFTQGIVMTGLKG